MGLFSSKIIGAVAAGSGVTLLGLGLLFNGSETLEKATNYVNESGHKILQYEKNENDLIAKIGLIKENAQADSQENRERIAQLESQKSQLEATVNGLNENIVRLTTEINELKATLNKEQTDHQGTKEQLAIKTAELDATQAELRKIKQDIADIAKRLQDALKKVKEGDRLVTELEGEVQKANAEVKAHGDVVDENKIKTKDAVPMTPEEIEAIGTEVE